jgi:hypothetical protein
MKMKKIVFMLFVFTIISCENQQDIMKTNISEKIKSEFKNPDSFEFVSMNISDTFSVKDRKQIVTKEKLEEIRDLNKEGAAEDLLKHIETEYNFLQKQTDDNKEAVYYVDFVAKGTNSFGAVIQSKYSATVLNDENLTVLSTSQND